MDKTPSSPTIVRTERGLTIAGTRVTLYEVLEYLREHWSPDDVRQSLRLNEAQWRAVLDYIAAHQQTLETEYQQVVHDAEEARRYWETRNRGRLAQPRGETLTPEREALQAKMLERKAQLAQHAQEQSQEHHALT